MGIVAEDYTRLWPLVIYFIATICLAAAMIGLSYVLGQRHKERATGEPYESGIASTGTAQIRFDVRYYLIAMFFVIFDLETVFIFAWAVSVRELGWPGYIEMMVFIGVLVAVLIYLWRLGALDWTTIGKRAHIRRGEN
jgi:NADH-quinone oxidoreductase subunit A